MRLFGVSLEVGLARDGNAFELPAVVDRVIEFLDAEGLSVEGLFRLSGSQATISKLKEEYDAGGDPDLFEVSDPHCVAGLLKLYLRELPEPLLLMRLFHAWVAAGSCPERDAKIGYYRSIFEVMPKPHRDLLRHLASFLARVHARSAVNKMTIANLSVCIGPNILRQRDETMMSVVQYTSIINAVTADLLELHATLFADPPIGAPFSFISVGQAQFSYAAQFDGELSFPAEAYIFIMHKESDGWWEGSYNGKLGIFPHNYVKVIAILRDGDGSPQLDALVPPPNDPLESADSLSAAVAEAIPAPAKASAPAASAPAAAPGATVATPKPSPTPAAKPAKPAKPADSTAAPASAAAASPVAAASHTEESATETAASKKEIVAEVARLKDIVAEDARRYRALAETCDRLETNCRTLAAQCASLSMHASELQAELAKPRASAAGAESDAATVARLNDELARARVQENTIRESEQAMLKRLRAAQTELTEAKASLITLESAVTLHSTEAVMQRQRAELLLTEKVALVAEKDALEVALAKQQADAKRLEQRTTVALTAGVEAAQTELVEVRLDLRKARARIAELESTEARCAFLTTERDRLVQEAGDREARMAKLAQELAAAQASGSAVEDAERARAETLRVTGMASELSKRLKAAEARASSADELQLALHEARRQIAVLEVQVQIAGAPSALAGGGSVGPPPPASRGAGSSTGAAAPAPIQDRLEAELAALEAELAGSGISAPATPVAASRRPAAQSAAAAAAPTNPAEGQYRTLLQLVREYGTAAQVFADVTVRLEPDAVRPRLQQLGAAVKAIKGALGAIEAGFNLEALAAAVLRPAIQGDFSTVETRSLVSSQTQVLTQAINNAVSEFKTQNGL